MEMQRYFYFFPYSCHRKGIYLPNMMGEIWDVITGCFYYLKFLFIKKINTTTIMPVDNGNNFFHCFLLF